MGLPLGCESHSEVLKSGRQPSVASSGPVALGCRSREELSFVFLFKIMELPV